MLVISEPFSIPLSSIEVEPRHRQDYGDIEDLAESIKEVGLIQPIVLARTHMDATSESGDVDWWKYTLVAGGRRLAALKIIDIENRGRSEGKSEEHFPLEIYHGTTCDPLRPGFIFAEELTLEARREAELVENISRKDYSWQERVTNICDVHDLKWRRNAIEGKTWGYRQSGALFGIDIASMTRTLQIAKELRRDPDGPVSKAATFSDAYRILLQRAEDEAKAELARRTMPIPQAKKIVVGEEGVTPEILLGDYDTPPKTEVEIPLSGMLYNMDCLQFMDRTAEGYIDHVITDTPYAIDMDMLDQQNPHGGMNDISRIEDTHDVTENMELLAQMLPRAFRVLRPSGFFVTWCDIMQWQYLYDLGVKAGFRVQRWPITWVKMHQCMNQCASYNFTKNTEIAIVMRKPGATLVKSSPNCVVMAANSVEAKKLGHPFVKPHEIWEYLLRHIAMPGQTILEPCAGVGSGVLSMLRLGFKVVACEIDKKHFDQLVINVSEHYKQSIPNCKFV